MLFLRGGGVSSCLVFAEIGGLGPRIERIACSLEAKGFWGYKVKRRAWNFEPLELGCQI